MTYSERASQAGKPKRAKRPVARPASLGGRLADTENAGLIFFGTEDFSGASLEALVENDWPVELIITRPDAPSGRGQKLSQPRVKQIGLAHNIPVLQPLKPLDIQEQIAATGAKRAILVAYGKIIPAGIIKLFEDGIINVHPSSLPKYRGPAPIEAAILNGDKQTAVSLMLLSSKMDAGPVYYQQPVKLSGHEDRVELSERLAQISAGLLVNKLPDIVSGKLKPKPQNEAAATYTRLITKRDGAVDWAKPAIQLEREVRAYAGWPKSQAEIFGQNIVITKARVAESPQDGHLVLAIGQGWLEVQALTAPSGRNMSGADFIRGYKKN